MPIPQRPNGQPKNNQSASQQPMNRWEGTPPNPTANRPATNQAASPNLRPSPNNPRPTLRIEETTTPRREPYQTPSQTGPRPTLEIAREKNQDATRNQRAEDKKSDHALGNQISNSEYRVPVRTGTGIAGALMSAIVRMDSAGKIRESLALAYWPRVVGPQATAATEVESVRDGVLFVRTKSSVWSHELTLHKTRILFNLNRMLGGKIITEIVFRAQGVTREEVVVEPEMPNPEELAAVILEDHEKDVLRGQLRDLSHIANDRIREVMAQRMTQEAKLRHWRLERGWHVCRKCDAVHKTHEAICPLCRLANQPKPTAR